MITNKQMKLIGSKLNVDVRIGDYPYAAWYTQDAYEKGEWEGYWFANPSDKPITVYVSENESNNDKVFGFFHEIGHVLDYLSGKKFNSTWDDEVSAWKRSLNLMINKYKLPVDLEAFRKHSTKCLATYHKSENKTSNCAQIAIDLMLEQYEGDISKIKKKDAEPMSFL